MLVAVEKPYSPIAGVLRLVAIAAIADLKKKVGDGVAKFR